MQKSWYSAIFGALLSRSIDDQCAIVANPTYVASTGAVCDQPGRITQKCDQLLRVFNTTTVDSCGSLCLSDPACVSFSYQSTGNLATRCRHFDMTAGNLIETDITSSVSYYDAACFQYQGTCKFVNPSFDEMTKGRPVMVRDPYKVGFPDKECRISSYRSSVRLTPWHSDAKAANTSDSRPLTSGVLARAGSLNGIATGPPSGGNFVLTRYLNGTSTYTLSQNINIPSGLIFQIGVDLTLFRYLGKPSVPSTTVNYTVTLFLEDAVQRDVFFLPDNMQDSDYGSWSTLTTPFGVPGPGKVAAAGITISGPPPKPNGEYLDREADFGFTNFRIILM